MALRNAFGDLALDSSIQSLDTSVQQVNSTLENGVETSNIDTRFRDSFQSFEPEVNWSLTQDSDDIVQVDGNALASSYLVISKSPLKAGSVTSVETATSFKMPLEVSTGFSLSQRIVGQELAVEVVSIETPSPPFEDIEISSIQQTTTTLTVETVSDHNLVLGARIGIRDVSHSRLNYPALIVATTPTPTTFTCTAGPAGTIPSITIGPFSSGFVYARQALGGAPDGISEIFENTTATNASLYQRAAAGDAQVTGTPAGNHSVTVGTTNGTQTTSPYTYAWFPSTEYRMIVQADRVQYYDSAVDAVTAATSRLFRTQVVPDPSKDYKLRYRFTNNKSLTTPTAKIVSATKSGSTTATIATDEPHGLTTDDFIVIYGIRNQTNFANLTTATQVASVPSGTSFTVAFGASATSTSYGGMVARVNGGNIPAAFSTIVVQSATNNESELVLTGNATWTWLVGDYVEVYGVNDDFDGTGLGVDGSYKVAAVATTTLTLVPVGNTVLPAAFGSTACGGTVIRRTTLRLSFARVFDYLRQRVEVLSQPTIAGSVPVATTNTVVTTAAQSGTWTVAQGTSAAITAPWAVSIQSNGGLDLYYQSQQAFSSIRSQISST